MVRGGICAYHFYTGIVVYAEVINSSELDIFPCKAVIRQSMPKLIRGVRILIVYKAISAFECTRY